MDFQLGSYLAEDSSNKTVKKKAIKYCIERPLLTVAILHACMHTDHVTGHMLLALPFTDY